MSFGMSVPILVFEILYFSVQVVMATSKDSRGVGGGVRDSPGQLDLAVAISGRTTGAKLGSLLETGN